MAQAASFKITLSDGTDVVGEVQAFEDGVYRVATPNGEVKIEAQDVRGMEVLEAKGAAPLGGPAGSKAGVPPIAAAGGSGPVPEFTLLTGDSKLIVGRLNSFEDGVYEIATKSGPVRVPVERVQKVEIAWLQPTLPTNEAPAGSAVALSPGELSLVGSNAMSEGVAPAVVEAFLRDGGAKDLRWSRGTASTLRILSAAAAENGRFNVEMRVRNSAAAVDALMRGEAEIAMMSRRMTAEEAQRLVAAGLGNPLSVEQEHVIAPGGIVILVHPSNPIKNLRLEQIADIFAGRIRSWGEVGGPQRRIGVYSPAAGSGLLSVFQARVMGSSAMLATAKAVGSNVEMAEIISADPTAIGIVEYSHVGNATALGIIDECGKVQLPNEFTLRTEDYPLTTRLYFYTQPQVAPLAREFIAYALSDLGQRRISERGYVSLAPALDPRSSVSTSATGVPSQTPIEQKVSAELTRLSSAANRLSVVFRFEFAGVALDTRGEKDLARLAAFLKSQTGQRRKLALVGFSDAAGPPESNLKLSDRRAKLVAQKLKQAGFDADMVVGFGTLLPVTCGSSAEAAARNRRVEAWLY